MLNLTEALLQPNDRVVAFVGGGGKTSLMFRLAKELAERGERVVATTTTNIMAPGEDQAQSLILSEDLETMLDELRARLRRQHLVAVGTRMTNAEGKMKGIPPEWVAEIASLPDVDRIIVEADGSAGRPFKAPADHEPVIPDVADLVVPVVGIDVLGQPLGPDIVHRPERVMAIAGISAGEPILAEVVARVLVHPLGTAKGAPARARVVPVVNKVDSPEQCDVARQVAWRLLDEGAERVVLARAQFEPPVWEAITRK